MGTTMELDDVMINKLKQEYIKEVVQPSFPFIKYFGGTSYGHQYNSTPKVSFHLSPYNVDLKGDDLNKGDYYFSEADKFIHYTSLKNAINILNDGFFRLNSLSYMDDPQELLYAGRDILGNYNNEELMTLKENVFCISMCEYDPDKSPEIFDSWRLYGDNGKGVGLVFKFSTSLDNWTNHYLSRIYYGHSVTNNNQNEQTTEKFRTFQSNHDKFIQKHESSVDLMSNPFGRKGKIPEWIAIFLAFHKSSLYNGEKEVRLLKQTDVFPNNFNFNNRFEKTTWDKILIKTKENLRSIHEKSQNIWTHINKDLNNEEWIKEMTKATPIIVLEKIIIGYRQKNNVDSLRNIFKEGFQTKNGFDIDVELSELSKAF